MTDIEQIHLGNNLIDEYIECTTPSLSSLTVLKLNGNKITHLFKKFQFFFQNLKILDISHNLIQYIPSPLSTYIPKTITQLYLSPNPFIGKIKQYRKSTISQFPNLVFLDKSFVSDEEAEISRAASDTSITAIHLRRSEQRKQELENRITGLRKIQSSV